MTHRFKIDIRPGMPFPFGLFIRRTYRGWFRRLEWWSEVEKFDTVEQARKHYEKIKDLPEYLP
jgi:hypothetical protein